VKPTIKDIARRINVSPATVSNALNNKNGVSEEVKQLVIKTAREMGYFKNRKNKNTIRFIIFKKHGYIVSDTPFFSSLIEGIEKECKLQGYDLLVSHINFPEEGYRELKSIINNDSSSGLLILATEMTDEDFHVIYDSKIPVVLLDNYFRNNDFDSVLINNTDSSFIATKFLINRGHKEIGYLKGSIRINNFYHREQGYIQALREYGLEVNEKYQMCLEPTMDGAYRDMKKILSSNIHMPTAFFADNDIIAFGAMRAMKEAGIKIPEDVSIIGFDDMPFCDITNPRLTTIKVFKQEMGGIAVKRLIQKITDRDCVIQKIEVCTQLIVRESVKTIDQ